VTSPGDGRGLDPFGQPYRPGRGLDTIGWFIATSHQLPGHDKAAALLGVPPGDKGDCLICAYEADPGDERKAAVIDALMAGKPARSGRPERP
jgi:hypothetical protein